MAKTVLIGSARGDENGKAYGGKAGDQTGREVSTQNWYLHSKGWRVLRCIHADMRPMIADAMCKACANDNIGYDQYQRDTLYKAAEKLGWAVENVNTPVETDCSALVRVCVTAALYRTGRTGIAIPDVYTGNLASKLLATGIFAELTETKYTTKADYLGAGDILVTKAKGHTVIVLSDGELFDGGAETESCALGERTLRKGDEGEDVRTLQEYLIKLGYSVGNAGTDGIYGGKTADAVQAFQTAKSLAADGIYGAMTHDALMAALETKSDAPEIAPEAVNDLTVKSGTWNLRTGPGTAYPVAAVVQGGAKLSALSAESWIPVLHDGQPLWISKKALEG